MGQATVDLPDPLEQPDSTRQQSADDLLSRLAGEEIDRLLADAGTPTPAPAPLLPDQADEIDPFEPPPAETEAEQAETAEPKAAEAKADEATTPPQVDAAKDALDAQAAVAAQLDDLFDQLSAAPAGEPKPTDAPIAEPATEATPSAELKTVAAEVDAALASGTGPLLPPVDPALAEEKAAAGERAALSATTDALEQMGAEAQAQADADKLPLYLRPLEWINAPLDRCPDAVRQAFGKLAILTLFNSLAVLLYVLIFRRHH